MDTASEVIGPPASRLITVCVAICLAASTAAAQITIALPDWAATASCRTVSPDGQFTSEPQRGRIAVVCNTAGVIACDGHGIEPLDVPVESACGLAMLPLRAAMEVRVLRDAPAEITVEWLSLAADGAMTTLARRPLQGDTSSTIAVANLPDRWVRFQTPGLAPLTVSVASLLTPDGWRLPELRPGGELFLTFDPAALPPRFYRLTGPFISELREPGPVASLHGLLPGAYDLYPVYDGPVEGLPFALTIAPATSTVRLLKLQPVGAAVITADADACATAEEFKVGPPSLLLNAPAIVTTRDLAACRWVVGGLPPGFYDASLWTARGAGAHQPFNIVANQVVQVSIPVPAVTVSGQVLVNQQPPVDAVLSFLGRGGRQAQVRADGTYDVALDAEGQYEVLLKAANGLRMNTKATVQPGANTVDLLFDDRSVGTRLTVRVRPVDPAVRIDVEISRVDGSEMAIANIPVGQESVTQRGLKFGVYRVIARQPSATSEWQEVSLSAGQMEAIVDLVLTRASRSITLRDSDGELITGASFSNVFTAPEQLTPGTYSLGLVAPGTELVIRVPFGPPLCRIVHAEGNVDVLTLAGRSVTLQFENPRITVNDVRLSSPGPSDCPVPLARFLKTTLAPGPGQSRSLEVLNAPADDLLIIHTRDGVYRALVPPNGRIVIASGR